MLWCIWACVCVHMCTFLVTWLCVLGGEVQSPCGALEPLLAVCLADSQGMIPHLREGSNFPPSLTLKMFPGRGWRLPSSLCPDRYPLAVTKYRESELCSSSVYNQNDPWDPPVVFEEFLNNNENIEDEVPALPSSSPTLRPDPRSVPRSVPGPRMVRAGLLLGEQARWSLDLPLP